MTATNQQLDRLLDALCSGGPEKLFTVEDGGGFFFSSLYKQALSSGLVKLVSGQQPSSKSHELFQLFTICVDNGFGFFVMDYIFEVVLNEDFVSSDATEALLFDRQLILLWADSIIAQARSEFSAASASVSHQHVTRLAYVLEALAAVRFGDARATDERIRDASALQATHAALRELLSTAQRPHPPPGSSWADTVRTRRDRVHSLGLALGLDTLLLGPLRLPATTYPPGDLQVFAREIFSSAPPVPELPARARVLLYALCDLGATPNALTGLARGLGLSLEWTVEVRAMQALDKALGSGTAEDAATAAGLCLAALTGPSDVAAWAGGALHALGRHEEALVLIRSGATLSSSSSSRAAQGPARALAVRAALASGSLDEAHAHFEQGAGADEEEDAALIHEMCRWALRHNAPRALVALPWAAGHEAVVEGALEEAAGGGEYKLAHEALAVFRLSRTNLEGAVAAAEDQGKDGELSAPFSHFLAATRALSSELAGVDFGLLRGMFGQPMPVGDEEEGEEDVPSLLRLRLGVASEGEGEEPKMLPLRAPGKNMLPETAAALKRPLQPMPPRDQPGRKPRTIG